MSWIHWKYRFAAVWFILISLKFSDTNPNDDQVAIACENSVMSINCRGKGVIRIKRANYGRFSDVNCHNDLNTDGWNVQCASTTSTGIVKSRCDGWMTCNITASDDVFEDRCPKTYKYLQVHYDCEKAYMNTTSAVTVTTEQVVSTTETFTISNGINSDMTYFANTSYVSTTASPTTDLNPTSSGVSTKSLNPTISLPGTSLLNSHSSGPATKSSSYVEANTSLLNLPTSTSSVPAITSSFVPAMTSLNSNLTSPVSTTNSLNITSKPITSYLSTYSSLVDNGSLIADIPLTTNMSLITIESATTRDSRTAKETSVFEKSFSVHKITTTTTAKKTKVPVPTNTSTTTTTTTTTVTTTTTKGPFSVTKTKHNVTPSWVSLLHTTIRRTRCNYTKREGILWAPVYAGETAERPCPRENIGIAKWLCGKTGWVGKPDLIGCVAPWLQEFTDQIIKGTKPAEMLAEELKNGVQSKEMGSGDINVTTMAVVPKLLRLFHTQNVSLQAAAKFTDEIVFASSLLLEKKQEKGWKDLQTNVRLSIATSLMINTEKMAFQVAAMHKTETLFRTFSSNIRFELEVADASYHKSHVTLPSPDDLNPVSDTISIPKENLGIVAEKGLVRIVCIIYRNLSNFLNPEYDESLPHAGRTGSSIFKRDTIQAQPTSESKKQQQIVNTKIMSASISQTMHKITLVKPIQITLEHLNPEHYGNSVCVFWKVNKTVDGRWSDEGCRTLSSNDTHTICECDHMTSFAVLMDVRGTKLSERHSVSLSWITLVGCIISIVCLLLCFGTFFMFKNLQCDRNTIHKNLVLSLMIAEIIFLAGMRFTEYQIVCPIIAGLSHYFFLVAFAWMCLEGIQLYIMLIQVFEAESSRAIWYYLFGYGLPAIIVGITAAVDHTGYGTKYHCWLKTDGYFILSFIVPVSAVITVNIVMLSIAIYMMCKHTTPAQSIRPANKINGHLSTSSDIALCGSQTKLSNLGDIQVWIKGAAVLVVLLGLTWGFGILYINEETVVMAYIFTILNSLQGFFIFIFHCLMNEKVRKEYRKAIGNSRWLPFCIRAKYGASSGQDKSSTPNQSSSTGNNYLSRFWSGRKRKRSSTTSYRKSNENHNHVSDVENLTSGVDSVYCTGKRSSDYANSKTLSLQRERCMDSELYCGITGDLSAVDCSMVDSEFVSEYCQQNLQVSQEKQRESYSSGEMYPNSESDSIEKHRLSALSQENDLKNRESFTSFDKGTVPYNDHLVKVAEKERMLNDTENESLMYPTEAEKNLINKMLNQTGAGDGNITPNFGGQSHHSLNHSEPTLKSSNLSECDQQEPLLQTSTPNLPFVSSTLAYLDPKHSMDYCINGAQFKKAYSDAELKFNHHTGYNCNYSEC